MSKRITIMVKDDLDKKVRQTQAKLISKYSKNFSYSRVMSMLVKKGLKAK